jgi:hypothetical protein
MTSKSYLWRGIVFLLVVMASGLACAQQAGSQLMGQFGPYVVHFHSDPAHNDLPWLLGLEYESPDRWEVGASFFKNSFSQPSQYYYVGKRWFLGRYGDDLYLKVTGGALLGYKEPYEDKIPHNHNGIAPVILPALGYQWHDANAQVVFLGANGLLFTVGYTLKKW